MACNNCGECRYSSASKAEVSEKITSGGFEEGCEPDQEQLYPGLTYASPGRWSTSYPDGSTVTAESLCVSGAWTWSKNGAAPSPSPIPEVPAACFEEPPEDEVTETTQSNCSGLRSVTLQTYASGKWVKIDTSITVSNNQECE